MQTVLAAIVAVANLITKFLALDIAPSDITSATVPPDESVTCSKPATAC